MAGEEYSISVSGVLAGVRVLPLILGIGPDTGIGIGTTLIDTLLNLVDGLPRRGEAVIAAKGGANSILNPGVRLKFM